ncbi:MAG: TFIIB-type zinc ribbon-containing protein [Nanoarchaeota archaeon]
MVRNIHEVKECPDCASDNIVYDNERDQVICRDCGLIYEPLTPSDEERFEVAHGTGPAPREKPVKAAKKAPAKAKKPAKKAKKK